MQTQLFWIPVFLTGFVLGQTGANSTQQLQREFYIKTAKTVKVEIDCPLGKLEIKTKPQGPLAILDLSNSIKDFEYKVSYQELAGSGELKIGGSGGGNQTSIESFADLKNLLGIGDQREKNNRWRIMLKEAENLPYDLHFKMGLGDVDIQLGALAVDNLEFNCGLSEAKLAINAPNLRRMSLLKVENGMGSFSGKMLGNANFEKMKVSVGMGTADLDLRGTYRGDADIKVDVGMGSLTMKVPDDVDVIARVNASPFSSVDMIGLVQETESKYRSRDFGSGRPVLTFHIDVGMGSVNLEMEKASGSE